MGTFISDSIFDGAIDIAIRDTNIEITETNIVIFEGKTILKEIPHRTSGVEVTFGGVRLTEIRDMAAELVDGQFRADYNLGWLYFNNSFYPDGTSLDSISYTGRGVLLYPASRVIDADGNPLSEVSLTNIYEDGILVKNGAKILDFRENLEVTIDPLDPTRVIINASPAGGLSKFIDLSDAPSTYVGQAGKFVAVNSTSDGVIFTDEFGEAEEVEVFYAGEDGLYKTDLNGTDYAIEGEATTTIKTAKGLTVNQILPNGDFITGDTTGLTAIVGSLPTVTGNVATLVASASAQLSGFDKDMPTGTLMFFKGKFRKNSGTNGLVYVLPKGATAGALITLVDETTFNNATAGQWIPFSGITTVTNDGFRFVFGRASAQTFDISVDEFMAIPITNNAQLNTLTAEQISSRIPLYIEGINSIENLNIDSTGKNKFDGLLEIGDITTGGGGEVASTTRMRTEHLRVVRGKEYTFDRDDGYTTVRIFKYDLNFDFIGYSTPLDSGQTTETFDADYVRITIQRDDTAVLDNDDVAIVRETAQLELGATATEREDYITSNLVVRGTMRSVGSSFDTPTLKSVGLDFNDVVQSATTWAIASVLTNTHRFYKNLQSGLDYPSVPVATDVTNSLLKIGDITFKVVSNNENQTVDEENTVAINDSGNILIRVNKTTYPNSAAFEAYLQANDVHFEYELATPIPQELDIDGAILTSVDATFVQSSDNGLNNIFSVIQAENLKGRINLIDGRTLTNAKEIVEVQNNLDTTNEAVALRELLSNKVTAFSTPTDIEYPSAKLVDDRMTINETAIGLNTAKNSYPTIDATKVGHISVTQAVDLDSMEIDIIQNADDIFALQTDLGNVETKTNFITITEAINLDKVREEYDAFTGTQAVSSATTKPASNITVNLDIDDFKRLIIEIEYGGEIYEAVAILRANAKEVIISVPIDLGTASNTKVEFKLYRDTSTTLTAYYGRLIVDGAVYSNTGIATITISDITGAK